MENLVTKCCGSDYERDENSFCCNAKITHSGLCYDCKEHTEAEGYICNECEDWIDLGGLEPLDEYNDRMLESSAECGADAKRKYKE